MEWIAKVSDDYLHMSTSMVLFTDTFPRRFFGPDGRFHDQTDPSLNLSDDIIWRFPMDAMPAIFGAINRHMGGIDNPTTTRADFEYERKRVDKMLDTIIEVFKDAP